MLLFLLLACFATYTTAQWTPDPQCPYPSDHATRYPFPGNCSKYWECYNGARYPMDCPAGLEFNYPYQRCDSPDIAHCDPDPTATYPTLPSDPTRGPTSESNWTPDPMCPYPSEDLVYFPYEGDCTKYWECYEGNKYLYKCPNNLYWNEKLSECDYPENVDCVMGSTTPHDSNPTTAGTRGTTPLSLSTSESWTESDQTTEGSGTTGTAGTTEEPITVTGMPTCPVDTPDIVYFPDPTDCTKYYQCYAGVTTKMQCPAGLYWNQELHVCDFPDDVDCKQS